MLFCNKLSQLNGWKPHRFISYSAGSHKSKVVSHRAKIKVQTRRSQRKAIFLPFSVSKAACILWLMVPSLRFHDHLFSLALCTSALSSEWLLSNSDPLGVVVQLLINVWLFVTPRTATCQASLSFTISWSLLKLMSVVSMMPSHPVISSSVAPFSSCPQSFPASGSFQWVSCLHQGAKVLEL